MANTTQGILAQAEQLPEDLRVELAEQLLSGVSSRSLSDTDVARLVMLMKRITKTLREKRAGRDGAGEALVAHTPGVSGGRACIINTRIPVWSLMELRLLGASDEEILQDFPSLTHDHLNAAWRYYLAHPDEIEKDIAENEAP